MKFPEKFWLPSSTGLTQYTYHSEYPYPDLDVYAIYISQADKLPHRIHISQITDLTTNFALSLQAKYTSLLFAAGDIQRMLRENDFEIPISPDEMQKEVKMQEEIDARFLRAQSMERVPLAELDHLIKKRRKLAIADYREDVLKVDEEIKRLLAIQY